MIISSAPSKVILFGEHAVVYDKLGIVCSLDKRCSVRILPTKQDNVFINSKNFCPVEVLNKKELFKLFNKINGSGIKDNLEEIREIYKRNKLIPIFFVIANIFKRYGFKGLKIDIQSEIPKNLGSSSGVFSAISLGLLKILGKDLSKKEVSYFAYQGDLIAHGGTPSGIDNAAVTYGGYLKYRKSKGIESLKIDFKIPLLIVESGQNSKTAETVSYIRKKKKEHPQFVNSVLDHLDNISGKALEALTFGKLDVLGGLMFEYYQELKKLDISTEKLNRIIEIAFQNGALGAKPTGGWGGGCCLVLAENEGKIIDLMKVFKEKGFNSFQGKTGVGGVKLV